MRTSIVSLLILLTLHLSLTAQIYDKTLVETQTLTYEGDEFQIVKLNRKGKRIKAKYFAAKDPYTNQNVYERFYNWKRSKNIIAYSSGTYMDQYGKPEGLTIDNGIVVNKSKKDWDGLAIVYADGGIAVSNIKEGNLTITYSSNNSKQSIDLKNQFQFEQFIKWAEAEEATVFQTHLLAFNNELKIKDPSFSNCSQCKNKRERRFLAAVKDENGDVSHILINNLNLENTLYQGALKTLDYLKEFAELEVIFLINLDTGYQDVFQFYNSDGTFHTKLKGKAPINQAVNLLVYYYQ
jgi:hypothetical protein